MKAWERDVLEYRPKIGYTPTILTEIAKRQVEEGVKPGVFTPSPLAQRAAYTIGADVMDNVITSLSKSHDMLKTLDRCLSHDPIYLTYKAAKEMGDEETAYNIHLKNAHNIKGKPQLDVLPMLQEIHNEMESFLDFINQELFEGRADYNDLSPIRSAEEKAIDTLFTMESSNKTIDQSKLASRVQLIAAVHERARFYQNFVEQTDAFLKAKAKDYVDDDVESLVRHLSQYADSAYEPLKEALAVRFRTHASTFEHAEMNMMRSGGRDVRDMLDRSISITKQAVHDTYDPLLPYYGAGVVDDHGHPVDFDTNSEGVGAEIFKQIYGHGMRQIKDTYESIVTEHLSNTVLNRQQNEVYFGALNEKKMVKLFYDLVDLVKDELDRTNLDKEIPRFINRHRLNQPGSYCG